MKFAIALENTNHSLELLDKFFKKLDFCKGYNLEIFTVQESLEQESEIKELEKKVMKKLEKYNVKGKFIVDKGDPAYRISKLILDRNINIFVCSYEHSFFSHTFFEELVKETDIPIMVLR